MEVLKSCPFCGGKATIIYKHDGLTPPEIYVECIPCGCRSPGYEPSEVSGAREDIGDAVSWAARGWNLRMEGPDGDG